ncbi:Max-binding protein MNT [Halotydeus destructor]|nr:Max-binding protein MNT [Halotydeus destructor]
MSLDTLLEAARYLDKIEQGCADNSVDSGLNAGHLHVDPNLPISFQFHTYSSPSANGNSSDQQQQGSVIQPNGSTKNTCTTSSSLGAMDAANANQDKYRSKHGRNKYQGTQTIPGAVTAGGQLVLHLANSGSGARSQNVATGGINIPGANNGGNARRGRGVSESSDKDSVASSRHRELHKTLEKNRRAHLRSCFEQLKTELPKSEYSDKKTSHINIIHCAIKYIQYLKRMEWENEHEMERLARTKIRYQNHLSQAKDEMMQINKTSPVDIEEMLRLAACHAAVESKERSFSVLSGSGRSGGSLMTDSPTMASSPDSKSPLTTSSGRPFKSVSTSGSENDLRDLSGGEILIELAGTEYEDDATTSASEYAEDMLYQGSRGRGFMGMSIHA